MRVEPSELTEVISVTPAISPEPAFERRRDRRRHGDGIGARPAGGDMDGRKVDRRQARDRQEVVGDEADQKQPDRQQAWCRPAGG